MGRANEKEDQDPADFRIVLCFARRGGRKGTGYRVQGIVSRVKNKDGRKNEK
jgi:hypothetical protein